MAVRHFLSLFDLCPEELRRLLDRAIELKKMQRTGVSHRPLAGKTLAMLFEQKSTRTRLGFEVGMAQMGGASVFLAPQDIQLGRGESIEHTAKVFSQMVDAVMIRTSSHENLLTLAEHCEVPVINGMTSVSHPCQLLADMQTYQEKRGDIKGATVAFLGDGYNMCNSYIHAARQFGFQLRIACPQEHQPPPQWLQGAGEAVTLSGSPEEAVSGADLVVTDVWISMAHEDSQEGINREARLKVFRPYQVTPALMDKASSDALFMHCLPAHLGEEVSKNMLADARSVVWEEAGNRLHSQKALLEMLLA